MTTINTAEMNTNTYRPLLGSFLALLSSFSFAAVYLFSKAALNQIVFLQFGFYWFGIALTFISILFFFMKVHKQLFPLKKKTFFILVLVGLLELISTVIFFYSIKIIENPTIVSFLTNSIPVFVGLLSFIFLKEKFTTLEYLGIVLAIIGIFLVGYKQKITSFKEFFDFETFLVLLSSFIIAVSTVVIKYNANNLHPLSFALIRVIFLFSFFLISVLITKTSLNIPNRALANIFAGSLFGPVSGVILSIYALRYVEATIMSILVSTKSIITLILIFLVFGLLPKPIQIFGGILSFLGVLLLSFGQHKKIKNLRK